MSPMRSGLIIGLAAALVTLTAVPAHTEPRDQPPTAPSGGFVRLDPSRLGQVVQRPAAVRADQVVNALVELRGDPVAAQLRPDARDVDRRRAARAVKATQDAALPRLRAAGATAYGRLDTVLNAVQVRVRVADLRRGGRGPGGQAGAGVAGGAPGRRGLVAVHRGRPHPAGLRTERPRSADRDHRQRHRLHPRGFGGPGTVAAFADNDGTVIEPGHLSDGQGDGRLRLRRRRLRPRLDGTGRPGRPTGPRSAGLQRPRIARGGDRGRRRAPGHPGRLPGVQLQWRLGRQRADRRP